VYRRKPSDNRFFGSFLFELDFGVEVGGGGGQTTTLQEDILRVFSEVREEEGREEQKKEEKNVNSLQHALVPKKVSWDYPDSLFEVIGPTFSKKGPKRMPFRRSFWRLRGHFHEKCSKREIRCKVTKHGIEKSEIPHFSGSAFGYFSGKNL